MNRPEALTAYQSAKAKRDTRAMHDAQRKAYAATHDILRNGPTGGLERGWLRSIMDRIAQPKGGTTNA